MCKNALQSAIFHGSTRRFFSWERRIHHNVTDVQSIVSRLGMKTRIIAALALLIVAPALPQVDPITTVELITPPDKAEIRVDKPSPLTAFVDNPPQGAEYAVHYFA